MIHISKSRHNRSKKKAFNLTLALPDGCIVKGMAEISPLYVTSGNEGSSVRGMWQLWMLLSCHLPVSGAAGAQGGQELCMVRPLLRWSTSSLSPSSVCLAGYLRKASWADWTKWSCDSGIASLP